MSFDKLSQRLLAHRQDRLLRFWRELSAVERDVLTRQIEQIDFEQLGRLTRGTPQGAESSADRSRRAKPAALVVRAPVNPRESPEWIAARKTGEKALRDGRVGIILVAGGEGSRLGFPRPKGEHPIGPISKKPLFQLLAEQAVALSRRAGVPLPYYVMTSHATHDETVAFYESHGRFGMARDQVQFFQQGTMPAVDRDSGKVLLASKHELALNPDGHGGMIAALARSQMLDDMRRRGLELLYYHQVDNPLARVCESAFLGFHVEYSSEVSTKVVAKISPLEKMGVVVDVDGRTQIIEYSDLPDEVAALRDERGELVHWAGSTAIHVFNRAFLDRLIDEKIELPFHRAIKKVPFVDDKGERVEPERENAVKFERFIFDALPLARRALVVEARREDEFCPLKNRSGDFSAEHVKASLMRLHAGWLRAAGAELRADLPVEISPLYALDAEEVAKKLDRSRKFDAPVYLE